MSVLLEFSAFPTDKGSSVSKYVSQVVEMIKNENIPYKLTAMGSIIEMEEVGEALSIVEKACAILQKDSDRVYVSLKMDIQKNKEKRMISKIESIESKIGKVSKF